MFTKAGAKFLMERNQDARLTECTIRAHCQTHVFELPATQISTAHLLRPAIFVEQKNARATIVSDLMDYFQNHTPFQQFSYSSLFRYSVCEAISKYAANARSDRFPLFVVVEQKTHCRTQLEKGTCYIVDEGKYFGGDEGKDAIIAIRISDGPWPKLDENDTRFINFVLATVKIIQGDIEVIREIVGSSCFFDSQDRAVYDLPITIEGNLINSSPITEAELAEKFCELRKLFLALQSWHGKHREQFDVLCDALRLENIESDPVRRIWYLSLYEAAMKVLPEEENKSIYRCHSGCRNSIAHLTPNSKVDMEQFRQLQSDVIVQLRKIFLDA